MGPLFDLSIRNIAICKHCGREIHKKQNGEWVHNEGYWINSSVCKIETIYAEPMEA